MEGNSSNLLKTKPCATRHIGNRSYRTHGLHFFPFWEESEMPWKECSVMDERLQFVAELRREFGISRKTGYKISIATRNAGFKD